MSRITTSGFLSSGVGVACIERSILSSLSHLDQLLSIDSKECYEIFAHISSMLMRLSACERVVKSGSTRSAHIEDFQKMVMGNKANQTL